MFKKAPKICPYCQKECDYDVVQTWGQSCMEPTCPRCPNYRHQMDSSCDFMINAIDPPMEVTE
jgi:hypothetical protein